MAIFESTFDRLYENKKWSAGVAILLKIILLILFSSEFSSKLFQPFLQIYLSEGGNPWQYYFENNLGLDSFPYHGLMLFILAIPSYIIDFFDIENQLSVNLIFKTPLLLADLSIFYLLLQLNKRKKNRVIVFYFLNPVIVYAIYIHSQLDIIPMALLMASLYFLTRDRLVHFSIFLGLALATKLNVLVVLPLLFFYIIKSHTLKGSFLYILIPLIVLFVFDAYYLFSDGFLEMVLLNSKQSLLFDSYFEIGNLNLLLPIASVIPVYLHFFNQKKVNYDLLTFYLAVLFAALILSIYPAPGWYVWLIPFMSVYFIHSKTLKKSLSLYALFSMVYLTFFIFFHKSDYVDILYLGRELNFKIENEKLINVTFTFLEVTLLSIMFAFYKYGIKSNSVYSKNTNLTIGIGGDSGVGKTKLVSNLSDILGDKLLHIEGDGEHKWERGDENWNNFTHLDPKANFIHKQAEVLHELKLGNAIQRSEYDHTTGRFTKSSVVEPNEFIVISGLHPFYLPKSRKTIDFKIYVDTDELLRRHWKIIRDTKTRGYNMKKIMKQIETRVADTKKFIYPQKEHADFIVKYFSLNKFTLGDENESLDLGLRIEVDANVHIEDILSRLNCNYFWDYNDDLKSQFLELREVPNVDYSEIATDVIKNIDEIISLERKWGKGYEGLIQLISLKMMSEKLQNS